MREIKFRAWSKADKRMYADVWFDNLEVHWFDGENNEWTVIGDRYASSMLHQAMVMQFTGLKDKNGKEIYEGDIVKRSGNNYAIYWDNYNACWRMTGHTGITGGDMSLMCEIIGNIYSNPEQLGVKE